MKDSNKTKSTPAAQSTSFVGSFPQRNMPCSMGGYFTRHQIKLHLEEIIRKAGLHVRCGLCRHKVWAFLLILQAATTLCAWTQIKQPVPALETIISRMAQAREENRASFRAYVVTRDYNFFGKEKNISKSQVIADISFVPPDSKNYTIQQTKGSGLGEKVVRRMLESEMDIAKNHGATDISTDNYDFRFDKTEEMNGETCYLLELLPKRIDKNLLKARIWVDANTFVIRRMEGEPAKSLSWWLRNVRITFLFGEVGGMWLQTASESTVNVRILGRYTMVANSINYKMSGVVADLLPDKVEDISSLGACKQNNSLD
jgi:outer membrane lipoprotein-sorting protein